jgi:hypothetical protein
VKIRGFPRRKDQGIPLHFLKISRMGKILTKAHKGRYQILEFLWNRWEITDMKITDSESSAFTISEIAIALKLDRALAEEQVIALHQDKEIDAIETNSGEVKYFINEKGFSSVASGAMVNEKRAVARNRKSGTKFSIF